MKAGRDEIQNTEDWFQLEEKKNKFIVTEGKKDRTDVILLIQVQKCSGVPNMVAPVPSR